MLLPFTATISYGMILFTPLIRWANTSELLPEVIFHGAGVNLFTTVPCATLWKPILRAVILKPDVTQQGNAGGT